MGSGMGDSGYVAIITVLTWVFWIPIRLVMPCYLCYGMFTVAIPQMGIHPWPIVFSYFTGITITLFCALVFVADLTPKCLKACRKRSEVSSNDKYETLASK